MIDPGHTSAHRVVSSGATTALSEALRNAGELKDRQKPKVSLPTERTTHLRRHTPAQEDPDDNIGNRIDERKDYQELPDGFSIVHDYPQFRQLVASFRKLKCEAHANMDVEGTPKAFPRLVHLEVCYRGYYFIQVRSLPLNLLHGSI